jgi:hypothetical protein
LYAYAVADVVFAGLLTSVLWTVITYGVAGALIGAAYSKVLERSR